MILKGNNLLKILVVATMLVLGSCVKNQEFETPDLACSEADFSIIGISELKGFYKGETVQIQEDVYIKGYVTSSDKSSNFFNVIHFQNEASNPTEGLQFEFELRDSHLFFDVGQLIIIRLKGLYLGQSNDVFKIGGVFISFGNRSVGRLPKNVVFDHILTACDSAKDILPTSMSIPEINNEELHTLVSIDNVEFREDEIGQTFAIEEEETKRILVDCNDNELIVLNSGYSDFQSEFLPDKKGTATGIITKDKGEYQLIIRELEDIDFKNERCEDLVDEFTSDAILITELADPDNNAGARFVELYNASDENLSLKGWRLVRYTNDNTDISSTVNLSEYSIEGKGLLVISPNESEFQTVYGFIPQIAVGTNSPADSNGDDTIALIDPFGAIIDIFGVIGEDGSGTDHEFEDGRAVRNMDIVNGNANYTASEWIVFNDSGAEGTINQPQNAPTDFTPGVR